MSLITAIEELLMGRPRTRWHPGDDPHTFTRGGRRFTVLLQGSDSSARARPRPLPKRFNDSLGRRGTRWVTDLDEARALAHDIAAALEQERAASEAGMSLRAAGATVPDLVEWWGPIVVAPRWATTGHSQPPRAPAWSDGWRRRCMGRCRWSRWATARRSSSSVPAPTRDWPSPPAPSTPGCGAPHSRVRQWLPACCR
jgi:hypothetical protein